MAYTTTSILLRHLGIASASENTILEEFIDDAKALIDGLTGRTFEASADTTRYFNPSEDSDGVTLYLDKDLCAITTITNGDGVVVASDEYTTIPKNETPYYAIKLLSSSGKSWTYSTDPEDSISIEGKWAYSTTAPELIQTAARDIATIAYRQKDSLSETTRPIMTGDGNIIMPDQYPKSLQSAINVYRRLV